MKNLSMPARLAATGAAAALVAGSLIGLTTTPANAAPITNTYLCDGPTSDFPVTLESDIPALAGFPTVPAGFSVPPALDVLNTFTVPSAVITTMTGFSITSITAPDFAGILGTSQVGVDGVGAAVADATDNGDGTHSFDANGLNAAFETPKAGSYDVLGPAAFTIDAYNAGGAKLMSVPCTLQGANGSYHSIEVLKNKSVTTGKAVAKTLKTTKVAKMKVAVTAPNETPGGQVLVKKGTNTLGKGKLNSDGLATVALGKLKKGKHAVKVIYKGDGYTLNSESEKITFTVVKP